MQFSRRAWLPPAGGGVQGLAQPGCSEAGVQRGRRRQRETAMGGCFPDADLRGVRGTSRIWIPDTDAVSTARAIASNMMQS